MAPDVDSHNSERNLGREEGRRRFTYYCKLTKNNFFLTYLSGMPFRINLVASSVLYMVTPLP